MELKNALDNLSTFIVTIKKQLDDNPKHDTEAFLSRFLHSCYSFSREGLGGLIFEEKEALQYRIVVSDVHLALACKFRHGKNLDALHISKQAIESAIQATILRVLDNLKCSTEPFDKRLNTYLAELKETLLKKPEPWFVHMEVHGIAPECLPYNFGEIEFGVADSSPDIGQRSGEQGSAESMDKTSVPGIKGGFGELFAPTSGAIYAKVPIEATDAEAAKVLAERKLRLTVDALNYFGDLFDVLESRVTLPGDATAEKVKTFIYSQTTHERKHTSVGWTKPFLRFSFASTTKSSANASGFERVGAILANPSLNSLDERILSSIQWAGRASIEGRREQAFLLFCISLEALLLSNRSTGEITQTFALRGAHLLVADAARRKEAFKDLKFLYGIRSNIVHSGHTQVTEADLSKIRWLAKTALLIMLVREPFSIMKKEEELEDWFESQLLAGRECTSSPQGGGAG
jgi:hypothetical protein